MKQSQIITIELYPDDGMWLTQKELQEGEQRLFSDSVFCPPSEADKWIEVDNAYKEQWEEEHPADMGAEAEASGEDNMLAEGEP